MKKLFLLAIFVPLVSASAARAADPLSLGALNSHHLTTDLPYEPDLKAFPAELSPLVDAVRALQLSPALAESAKGLSKSNTAVTQAVELAQSLKKTVNRGYLDELYTLLGLLYERGGDPERALDAYSHSLSFHPTNPAVVFRHAYLLRQVNQCDRAIPELREVTWLSKEYAAEVKFTTAQCLITEGKLESAVAELEEAQKLKPTLLPITKLLLKTRTAQLERTKSARDAEGIKAKIAADLTVLVSRDPNDNDSALLLAQYLFEHSDPFFDGPALKRAEGLAAEVSKRTDFKDDTAVHLLAAIQEKSGDLVGAEKTIQQGLLKNPNSPILLAAKQPLGSAKE